MRNITILVATMLSAAAAPALAVTTGIPACASTDISFAPASGASYVDCRGFFEGNLLNNASSATLDTQLNSLGYAPFTSYSLVPGANIQSGLGGATVINFTNPLFGDTWFGIRYGAGQGSPGRNAQPRQTDTTALYRINAGTAGLTSLTLNYQASSTFTLFATGSVSAAPEPATWAMMIVGFGAVGVALRRRKALPKTATV